MWLIIFWIILRFINASRFGSKNYPLNNKSERNSMDYIVIGLMIISIVDLFITYVENVYLDHVFEEFVTIFALFIGFFIIKNILSYFNILLLKEFLFIIVLVNSLASCLYILHQGLHIFLYHNNEYISEIFQGELITRTFWFMPLLWFFSISYLFIFKKNKSFITYVLLFINLIALFISYTRSFLVITFFIFVLYSLLNGYKENNFLAVAKNIIWTILIGIVLFVAISKFFPANADYFLSRFKELKQGANNIESNSLLYRFSKTGEIFDRIDKDKLLIGYGPVTQTQIPLVSSMSIVNYDLVWTGVVFRWGIVGLVLFVLLYVVSIIKAFYIFIENDGLLSKLALLLLLVIVSQVIESFVSSTFLSSDRYVMGLWYLGMLSGLVRFSKKKEIPLVEMT
jgi:hypothetical protein